MAFFTLLGLLSCGTKFKNLTVEEFQGRLNSGESVQLLDVRTPQEYAEGHIQGAVNIDWLADGFVEAVQAAIDPEKDVLIYCRRGRRSAEAADTLSKLGYKRIYNLQDGFNAWKNANMPITVYDVERFYTSASDPIDITLIKHASLAISYKGLSIQVDPVSKLGDNVTDYATCFPEADYVLVTHEHADHFDKEALSLLGGEVITNDNCAKLLDSGKLKNKAKVLANGDSLTLQNGIVVEAVPAYNTSDGREQFHPKGRDNGYILNLDGFRIYIAGDTEDIPEMAGIKDIDVAFLPCNQPYTMTPEQLIHAARMVQPKVLIPYHFSRTNLSGISAALPGVDVRLRRMQ